MSPARALVTERPLPDRTFASRSEPDPRRAPQPTRIRTRQEVDALVSEHLPLAQFAVNAVASRISLPSHVSREDLLS